MHVDTLFRILKWAAIIFWSAALFVSAYDKVNWRFAVTIEVGNIAMIIWACAGVAKIKVRHKMLKRRPELDVTEQYYHEKI